MSNDDHDLVKARQQAVLENPDGCSVTQLTAALATLDDDEQEAWLEDHPEIHERLKSPFGKVVEGLAEVLSEDPLQTQYLEFTIDERIYQNAVIHTRDGETHPLDHVYLWMAFPDGTYTANIKQNNVPPEVDLQECQVGICSDEGIPLLRAPVVSEPTEPAHDVLCVKLDPSDRDV
ncbi:hypothetical protein [Natrinema soli]|uniref:Uncharacterized protein n=1 Tax=Natrinema soli TaxID=1930624 RepID=A0ABD5SEU2_9EURY|nr:hypothetical protein [Natrinema soli]